MSNFIGFFLEVEENEDIPKIEVRARALMNEIKLDLGPEDRKELEDSVIRQEDLLYSGIGFETTTAWPEVAHAIVDVMEGVAESFPEMKLVLFTTWEGPINGKYVSENGKFVKVQPQTDENGCPLPDEAENVLFP